MTEKMQAALRAALTRTLFESIRLLDASYPDRATSTNSFLKHQRELATIIGWHQDQTAALQRMASGKKRPAPRRVAGGDQWGMIAGLFIGDMLLDQALEALPLDIRVMLKAMTNCMQLAMAAQIDICMRELRSYADTLPGARTSESGSGAAGTQTKVARPAVDPEARKRIEEESKALADRMKSILGFNGKPPGEENRSRPSKLP